MDVHVHEGPGTPATDAFVRAHESGTLFHESAWARSVEESFGHPAAVLIARDGNRISGVLPLSAVRSRLFGDRLVSSAFASHGGILATAGDAGDDARSALAKAALALAAKRGAKWVELRGERAAIPGAPTSDRYAAFRIPLAPTVEATLATLHKKMRQDLRRAEGKGFFACVDRGVEIAEFHRLYLHTLKAHGTPAFPRRWFESLTKNFPGRVAFLGIGSRGRFVGASMCFVDRGALMPYYSGVPRENYALRTTVALHAFMIRTAVSRGLSTLDLGRSKRGTGAFEAKSHWGVEPTPLAYQFLATRGDAIPDLSPANPRFAPLIAAWKWMPITATRMFGPPLVASLA